MPDIQLANLFLEQSNDLIWIIDSNFCLKYANQAYQKFMKQVMGEENKMDEPIFTQGFGDGYIEKWKAYYERGLNGEHFEVEESSYNPYTNQVEYSQISFKPLTDEHQVVVNVACQSRDITSFIKSYAEAEKIMDASLDVICQFDEHGIFTKVSAECKELWGYEKHELVGKSYIDFVIEEDIEKTNQIASKIIDGKEMTTFENRYRRKDGGIAFNLWSVRYEPKTKNTFASARDAREKIGNEELIIESKNRFKALVQEGSDLIAILDEAGLYTYVSPTSKRILGMDPEELIGKNPFDYIHPKDAEKVVISLNKITTESRVEVEPFRFKNKNGEWHWIETILTNMLSNPVIRGIVANSKDITARKKENQHLKLLETVVTNAKDVVLITEAEPIDHPGPKIVYVNDAFTKLTGYTQEEVIGKTPRMLQGPKSDFDVLNKLGKSLRKWEPYEVTTINYKKNGDEFWVNFTVIPVFDDQGWCTHWFAIERDVSEKKKLELSNNLTAKISALFKVELDLSSALSKLCEEVAVVGQFSFCEIWLADIQENLLELKAVHKSDEAANIFYEKSKLDTIFKRGQGLPGKIWENTQSIIWEYKGKNQELLLRSVEAEKAGIKTIVGFPLMYHEKFIGVLQIGTQTTTKNVEWIIHVFEELGAVIGAEIARKKTEIELTKIFEFAPDIIATCGFDGFFKTANPYTYNLLGYTEKEFNSKPLTDFLHPDDAQITAEQFNKLASGDPIYNLKNRFITKTGEIKTISWNFSPSVKDALIFCIGKDITEEVKIGSLLKESNQLSRVGSWEVNLINNSLFWSDITHEIHEIAESFKPQLSEAINFYREDFKELVTELVNACIEKGTPFDFEAIIVSSKNNEVWIRSIGKAEMVNGKCVRIFGSIQDIHQRKIIEQQKNSLLTTLENSLNEIYIFDAETLKFSYANQGALINIGYSEQEIKELTPLNLKPEFTTTTFNQLINPLVNKEKEKIIFFTNHKRKNGSLYPVEIHLQFVTEGNNKRFLAVILDITVRKKAEEKLLNAFKEKNNILESIGDAFFAVDNNWVVTYWNHSAELVLGKKKEDVVGKSLWNEYVDAMDIYFYTKYKYAIETMETQSFEAFYETTNQWVEVNAYPSKDGLSVYIKDITNKKEFSLKIQEANERFEKVAEATADAIWDWDIVNDKFYRGNGFKELFGHEAENVLNHPKFHEINFNKEDLPQIKQSVDNALLNPKVTQWEYQYRIQHSSGSIKSVLDKGIIIRDLKGKATRMIGAIKDITYITKHEKELLELNDVLKAKLSELEIAYEELEQFAYIASHDLQEPLRMISSFMDQLNRKYGGELDDKAHQYIEFAIDGAKRMKQIILDLLEYSRAGKILEEPISIDVNQILDDYKILRRKVIAEKQVMFEIGKLPIITTYNTPLIQVLHNLIDNSIKYAKDDENPIVKITCIERKKFWEFCIEDNGIGIDEKFFTKIFVIFQRLHDRDKFSGTGIGLSIVKKEVESLGGKIWIESKINEGSKFCFSIPK